MVLTIGLPGSLHYLKMLESESKSLLTFHNVWPTLGLESRSQFNWPEEKPDSYGALNSLNSWKWVLPSPCEGKICTRESVEGSSVLQCSEVECNIPWDTACIIDWGMLVWFTCIGWSDGIGCVSHEPQEFVDRRERARRRSCDVSKLEEIIESPRPAEISHLMSKMISL